MSAALAEIASYSRRLHASAERVWENVHDWEHLPFLHSASFRTIRCQRADASGWRAQVGLVRGGEIDLELSLDTGAQSYHSRTLSGPGAGTDIWTRVSEASPGTTEIAVTLFAPGVAADARGQVGAGFVRLYTRLWDEDEVMMQRRQAFLDGDAPRVARPGSRAPQLLGPEAALRARLPLTVDVGGDPFVVRAHGERLVAHSATCPHWGASLASAQIEENALVCPWHGYRFDLATGRGPASQRCRMPARAEVRVSERSEAWLVIA